jgi:hypothetical protein
MLKKRSPSTKIPNSRKDTPSKESNNDLDVYTIKKKKEAVDKPNSSFNSKTN